MNDEEYNKLPAMDDKQSAGTEEDVPATIQTDSVEPSPAGSVAESDAEASEPSVEETTCLSQDDKSALNAARFNKKIVKLESEKAALQGEIAELQWKCLILQLYMKYGLNDNDAITEGGDIVRGGAK